MAASVAEPPLRNISWPAALARGSAEETTPPAANAVEKGSAMRSRKERMRRRMARGPFSGGRQGSFNYAALLPTASAIRSEEHKSELQSLMRISYAVFCLKKQKTKD